MNLVHIPMGARTWHPPASCSRLIKFLPCPSRRHSSNSTTRSPKPRTETSFRRTRRFIPPEAQPFVHVGVLHTTPEHRAFLLRHDLEHDTGRMETLSSKDISRLSSRASVAFAFSTRHVLHPHDLRFFGPRGHPLAGVKRDRYAIRHREQPLWVLVTSMGGASGLVRRLTQQRLAKAVYAALRDVGRPSGLGDGLADGVYGTLWISVFNPVRAADVSSQEFGRVVADALVQRCEP